MKGKLLKITIVSMSLLLPLFTAAQPRFLRFGENGRLRKENSELKLTVDSLARTVQELQQEIIVKDSLAREMLAIYEENEDRSAAGLNPEDYSPEFTDSLLNIWYLHRQMSTDWSNDEYDMDSVHLTSNLSDKEMKARLENMNSFITLPYNETVRNYMVLYSEKMPRKMGNILGLCQYYMPIFEETFSKYSLPDELKYVAIIESALNPFATSRAGAKGMWQFMTKTAKGYGLEINSFVDERLDPIKSSDAAARYLADSYRLFGDWNLAISSYNCGPGNVNKAIRRSNGRRDFWSVYEYLPKETRGYVPAFVGAMYALRYSKEYGIMANGVQMPAQVDTFEIRKNLHFQQISDMTGISVEELENLNPQYIKDVIPGNSKPYILRLPFNYSSAFIAKEDSIYNHRADELLNPQTLVSTKPVSSSRGGGSSSGERIAYKVKSGDSLGKIAGKYHVTVNQLKSWNHLKSTMIHPGQTIYVYRGGSAPASSTSKATSSASSTSTAKPTASSAQASTSQGTIYKVKKGDSLYKIAQRYGTTVDKLMKYNGIGSKLKIGQTIKIPPK